MRSVDGTVPWFPAKQPADQIGIADIGGDGDSQADFLDSPDAAYARGVRALVYARQNQPGIWNELRDPTLPPDPVRTVTLALMNAGAYAPLMASADSSPSQGQDRLTLRGDDADDVSARVQQFIDDGLGPSDPMAAKMLELGRTSFADQFVATPYPEGSGVRSTVTSAPADEAGRTQPGPIEADVDSDTSPVGDIAGATGGGIARESNSPTDSQVLSADIPYPKPAGPGAFRYLAPNRVTGNIDIVDIDGNVISSSKAVPDYPWSDLDTGIAAGVPDPKPITAGGGNPVEAGAVPQPFPTGELRPIGPVDVFFTFNPAGQALAGFGKSAANFVPGLFNAGKELTVGGYDLLRYLAMAQTARGSSAPSQPVSNIGQAIQQQGFLPVAGNALHSGVTNLPGISTIGALYHGDYGRAGGSVFDASLAGVGAAGMTRVARQAKRGLSAGNAGELKFHARAAEKGYVGVRMAAQRLRERSICSR